MPGKTIYLSDPTWGNHKAIFNDAQVEWKTYRYFDSKTTMLDFEGMYSDIEAAPEGSVILLHGEPPGRVSLSRPRRFQGCAHNPTGIDPTKEQWNQIADLLVEKNHLPFFDVAYQGFATGSLEEDAFAPRLFVEKGMEVIVCQSYAKNLGLYAERIGALTFVVNEAGVTEPIRTNLDRLNITMFVASPINGVRIVMEVIEDPSLMYIWQQELSSINSRLTKIRQKLQADLSKRCPGKNWSFVTDQKGLYLFPGLSSAQVCFAFWFGQINTLVDSSS